MNPNISRRSLLRAGAGTLAAGLLAACTTTKSGTVTTITLNVAEVVDYGNAILSFGSTAINVSFVASAMGTANLALANTVIASLKSALAAFQSAAGSSTSVSYDSASVKAAFDSILADGEKVDTLIVSVIVGTATNLSSSVVSEAKTAAGAAETLIDLLKAMVDMSGPRLRAVSPVDPNAAIGQIAVFAASQG
ncbi:twin-arginine translocation signal domain-containing protein [Komagataeibacter europaeus]|uniref:twin-arginine translocation signal domain-containing protein n=1 Tax=Komagataeibacter europaeus TaxID=33995 RepID=UPI0015FAD0D4|nr:twin-arginine translocation signal domain-containing protein [Komagataeibacter europaeus]